MERYEFKRQVTKIDALGAPRQVNVPQVNLTTPRTDGQTFKALRDTGDLFLVVNENADVCV